MMNWLPELESFLRENRNREGDNALRDRFLEIICKEGRSKWKTLPARYKRIEPGGSRNLEPAGCKES